jgi:hypothetical protein
VTAVYILNRSPTKALDGRTPYESWHGRKPAVSHLRSSAASCSPRSLATSANSTTGALREYSSATSRGSKAYRILDPKTQHVHTARDVVFNKGRGSA